MTWEVELAKEFKRRNNKSSIGNIQGTVIKLNPLEISVLDGHAILKAKHLYISGTVSSGIAKGDITAGSSVLLIPDAQENVWFIIDTISKL